jgi:23S rRNA (uracil1939-C5)-methyltransferase
MVTWTSSSIVAGRRSATPELEGRVRDLGSRGEAVVETGSGVFFVSGALPGERVRIAPEAKKRRRRGGAQRGRLVSIIEASEERVEPPCEAQGRCGGCPLMMLSRRGQHAHKARVASEATGLEVSLVEVGEPLGYRRRARLALAEGRVGYRHPRSKRIVDIERCLVLEESLGRALDAVRTRVLPLWSGEGELLLARGGGGRAVTWIRTETPQPPELYQVLRDEVAAERLAGASLSIGGTAPAVIGDPREVAEGPNGEPLLSPAFGFSQANTAVNRALVQRVVALAEPAGERVLELYAGHGNLSVALAPEARSFVAVEQSASAAEACQKNLASRGLAGRVITADAGEGARRVGKADVVVLDPPRTGARDALPALLATRPARIVYVSCDLATLRRDLGELRAGGFEAREAFAFDMFPQTAHLETVVLLGPSAPTSDGV